jgi:hypothetical protein
MRPAASGGFCISRAELNSQTSYEARANRTRGEAASRSGAAQPIRRNISSRPVTTCVGCKSSSAVFCGCPRLSLQTRGHKLRGAQVRRGLFRPTIGLAALLRRPPVSESRGRSAGKTRLAPRDRRASPKPRWPTRWNCASDQPRIDFRAR